MWSNCANSSTFMWNYEKGYVRAYLETNDNLESEMNERVNKKIIQKLNCQNGFNKTREEMPSWVLQDSALSKKGKLRKKYQPFRLYKITCGSAVVEKTEKVEPKTINFTIKDKKEQCEAIGFKPQTEKFADCVLRLIELDVKRQQSNVALSNNNSTNNAIVKQLEIQNKQLERQRYDEGTKFLFDLSRQLSQPKSSSWSTCSYIDFGHGMGKVKCN